MSGHTPGPWHAAMKSEKTWNVGVYTSSGLEVASIVVKSASAAQRRDADARLISAAPEMYEALRDVFEYLDAIPESAAGGDDEAVSLARKCRAAIAKAEGK